MSLPNVPTPDNGDRRAPLPTEVVLKIMKVFVQNELRELREAQDSVETYWFLDKLTGNPSVNLREVLRKTPNMNRIHKGRFKCLHFSSVFIFEPPQQYHAVAACSNSMADVSPLPAAAGTMTQPSLKKIWSGLPYEIFLLIVDEMIEDAWVISIAEPLVVRLNTEDFSMKAHKMFTQPAGHEQYHQILFYDSTIHCNRLRRIRTTLHLNRKTRAMVEARFIRLPSLKPCDPDFPQWKPCMWLCPGTDIFYATLKWLFAVLIDIRRMGEMQHGSALQHLDNLRLEADSCSSILRFFIPNIAAIIKMSNLKSVTFVMEVDDPFFQYSLAPLVQYYSRRSADHPVPADVALSRHLEYQVDGTVHLWAPIWAKGIRVLIDVSDECAHHSAVGELFPRHGEIRVRLFPPPTCDCYKPE
ncbi:hypothetical protein CkaCkLH20_08937 [Colletotrichum karsti]|uniref:Uncharacterized protein n=1 Tax=Colletotrichum karsti TaxID=1095194 RepID=A0A9P6LHE1_9PEZI|nr:uncharacterized protein CkaCkLH20_08937 [Colletotrichum karsti]KAF9873478.1 hypothetical protein CkaCkLH20_08937 [Colletotrichum karsti]